MWGKAVRPIRILWLTGIVIGLGANHLSADQLVLGQATYIANEGVMIEHGETRVLFDPLFEYPHDYYQAIPSEMKQAIITGTNQFEGIDAVFISHFHADHCRYVRPYGTVYAK
jgi:glyoxylase-like metal-dependent hydrolase (beta-lactamase superfamily II)